jgi:hypothetical protein
MDTVILKDGSEMMTSMVTVSMMSLRSLLDQDPIAFYELVMICRNPEHRLFGKTDTVLRSLALLESDNRPHDMLRRIVINAVEGDDMEMKLVSPVAENQPQQDTVVQRADLNDFELYKNMRRIGDLIFKIINSSRPAESGDIGMEDRREEGSNSFYNQTSSGLYLEFYHDLPSKIWTPWGRWDVGGSGHGGEWQSIKEAILFRLGAKIHQRVRHTNMGTIGPVWGLYRVDDVQLPEPKQLDKSAYAPYEEVLKAWEALTRRYNEESRP